METPKLQSIALRSINLNPEGNSSTNETKRRTSLQVSTNGYIKIEDVYNELGAYSWFQFTITILLMLPEISMAMIVIAPIFTGTSNVPFACLIEGSIVHEIYTGIHPILCSVNCSKVIPHGQQYASIVQEWNLICDRAWINDFCLSIQMMGMMTGAFTASILADRFGRKNIFFLTTMLAGTFGVASGLAPNEYLYAASRFFAGVGVGGYFVVYSIYLIEFLTPSWRTLCGCISLWFLGEMFLTLAAYFISSWRILIIITSATVFLVILTYPVIPESPRYLLCNGCTEEAGKVFVQIANWNNKIHISSEVVQKLQESVKEEEKASRKTVGVKTSVVSLLLTRPMIYQLVPFLLSWFACSFVYYGITFNTKNLSGDPYLNVLFMALVDMPSFPSGAIFNNWLGRKKTFSCCFIFGAIFLVALVIVEESNGLETYPTLITVFCYLGRFGVSAAWGVVYCFSAESFPTVVRSTCLGLCALAGNVGGVVAPSLAYLGVLSPSLPYFVFCGVSVAAAFLSFFLVETNGKPLKNYVQ